MRAWGSGVVKARAAEVSCAAAQLLGAAALFSCAGALGEPELDEGAFHDTSGAPVIVTLQTREGPMTVTAAGGHVRYGLPGNVLGAQSLTLEEIEGRDPELYELLRQATAAGAAPGWAPFLDASRGPVRAIDASVVGVPMIDASRGGGARLRSR